jgi:hypothetical protein
VVYSQKPFDGAQHVYAYLSRYTHRVAISNHRLVNCQNGQVTFKARNNQSPENPRQVTLPAEEFIRRFLLHVLPSGFVKIRHYGLLSSANAKTKLETARTLILQMKSADQNAQPPAKHPTGKEIQPQTWQELLFHLTGINLKTCPKCKKGILVRSPLTLAFPKEALLDSS